MNKTLQQKVKDKCKDMGLSEDYVNGITEILGADVADDSTDEQAIEATVNRIADVAKRSQGEATRWAQAQKNKPAPTPTLEPTPQPQPGADEPDWFRKWKEDNDKRMKALEDENSNLKAERAKLQRTETINATFAKYEIPDYLRKYISVPDSIEADKIEEYVAGMSQEFVTRQLPGNQTQPQVASKQETEAAAEAFFKSKVKPENK